MSALRTKRYRAVRKALDNESTASDGEYDSEISQISAIAETIGDSPIIDHRFNSFESNRSSINQTENSLNLNSEGNDDQASGGSNSEISPDDFSRTGIAALDCADENETPSLTLKLREWTIRNISHVTNACVCDLLKILREEGFTELPKTTETLLGTARRGKEYSIHSMAGNKKAAGEYVYIGIQKQLEKVILPDVYTEDTIYILGNVDGTPLYDRSAITLWPILIHVIAAGFQTNPIMVGAFCGVSKPKQVNDYLKDFVEEASELIKNGIDIGEKHYKFKIVAFVCDTPARSFIKCTKGHTGFFSCERCEVKGETRGSNTRVFPDMDCPLRTNESFREKSQPDHHHKNLISPLIDIPDFDLINQVTLDYMHLLCVGVMKYLLEKWINGNRRDQCTMTPDAITKLQEQLDQFVTPRVPDEFQRKKFDLHDLVNWKATQNRFFLLYAGLIVKQFLSKKVYNHFLLLVAASRILCDDKIAVCRAAEAKLFLRKFFHRMPKYYGDCCQTMNMHNLIHVADDVVNLQMPLSAFSSFPFENYLGKLKTLIRTPRAPLSQLVRRLSEVESSQNGIQRTPIFSKYYCKDGNDIDETKTKIKIGNVFISTSEPDNIVVTENDQIVRIEKIILPRNWRNVYMDSSSETAIFYGYKIEILQEEAFCRPCSSTEVGIRKLGRSSREKKKYLLSTIKRKVIKLDLNESSYAVLLLHDQ